MQDRRERHAPLLAASDQPSTPAVAPSVRNASGDEPSSPLGVARPAAPRLNIGHYLILISLNCIGAFSSDCYIPNLSDVVDDLHANDQQVSLTIQINWIMLGVATPVVGHLSDVHGRKLIVTLTKLHPVNWGQLRANVCLPYRRGGAN